MQKFEFRLPEGWSPWENACSAEADLPEDARFFRLQSEKEEGVLIFFAADEKIAMPFGAEKLSERLKEEISSSEKLLFSKSGETAAGRPYVCDVLKRCGSAADEYMFNFNIKCGEDIYYLGGKFAGNSSPETVKEFYEYLIKNN